MGWEEAHSSPGDKPQESVLPLPVATAARSCEFWAAAWDGLGVAVCIRSLFKHSRAVLSLWNSRVLSPGLKQPEEFAPQALMPSPSPEGSPGMAPVVQ